MEDINKGWIENNVRYLIVVMVSRDAPSGYYFGHREIARLNAAHIKNEVIVDALEQAWAELPLLSKEQLKFYSK